MAAFRRQALTGLLLALAALSAAAAQDAAPLRLELTAQPGGLRIVNPGPAPVTIRAALGVEAQQATGWVAITTEFNAIARCTAADESHKDRPVEIAAGATLDIVPWRGFSCSGQCTLTCRANIYYGAGPFRFVATTIRDGQRVVSPSFTMPAQPHPAADR
jgi:hypothetical protein